MSDTNNPMVKTLPELPFTSDLKHDNLVWIHQEHDTTDRHTTLGSVFGRTFDMSPNEANVTAIGSDGARFGAVHSVSVFVGSAELSELSDVLHMPEAQVDGDLTITGNLTVSGTSTTINVQQVNIEDNIIEINSSQTGTPASILESGLEVNRGSEANYRFVFAESSQTFRVGESGVTQAVATREDTPADGGIAVWNAVAKRFDAKTSFDGTIEAANKLATPRRITLSGALSGFQDFDGSQNITIDAGVNNDSHTHDTRYYTQAQSDEKYLELNKTETITQGLTINGVLNAATIEGSSFSGNAATASKLQTARTIALSGDVVGSALFDGTPGGTTIEVTIPNVGADGHTHDEQYYPRAEADSTFVSISQVGAEADAITGNLSIDGNVTAATFRGPIHGNAQLDGNALTANSWKEMMTLTLGGDLEGTVSFDGAADKILNATVLPNSHSHDDQYYTKEQADGRFLNIDTTGEDKVQGSISLTGTVHADQGFDGDVDGNASTATQWAHPQEINVTGGATGSISIIGNESPLNLALTITDDSHSHLSANISDATSLATPDTVVRRDIEGSFVGNTITATSFVGPVEGNIVGNVTGNVDGDVTGDLTGNVIGDVTGNVTGSVIGDVTGNLTGNVTGDVTGSVTGNAGTASALQTGRTISISGGASGSILFDGSADVDIPLIVDPTLHTHSDIYYKIEADDRYVKQAGGDTINGDLTITGKLLGTATTADRLSTASRITLANDLSGNVAFDGSGDVSLISTVRSATGFGIGGGNYLFTIADSAKVNGSLEIMGDLLVNGATSTVNTQNLDVQDNFITLNKGVTTWSPTSETGIEFNRGDIFDNYQIKVVGDVVRLGTAVQSQAIATREDSPIANAPVIWNDTTRRFDTVNPSTEIAATVANATRAAAADALSSPQTITFSDGIVGSFIVGDNGGNKTVAVTVNKVASATDADNAAHAATAGELSTPQNIELVGAVTGVHAFDGSGAIQIPTILGTATETRLTTIENDVASNVANIGTLDTDLDGYITTNNARVLAIETDQIPRIDTLESRTNAIYVAGEGATPAQGLLANAISDITDLQTNKVDSTDSRLTDNRDPNAHTHASSDITDPKSAFNKDFGTAAGTVAEGNHTHTPGSIGAEPAIGTKGDAFNVSFGTGADQAARGNHTHSYNDLTDKLDLSQIGDNTLAIGDLNTELNNAKARITELETAPTIPTTAPITPEDGAIWIS